MKSSLDLYVLALTEQLRTIVKLMAMYSGMVIKDSRRLKAVQTLLGLDPAERWRERLLHKQEITTRHIKNCRAQAQSLLLGYELTEEALGKAREAAAVYSEQLRVARSEQNLQESRCREISDAFIIKGDLYGVFFVIVYLNFLLTI
jgi:hypothetical protein